MPLKSSVSPKFSHISLYEYVCVGEIENKLDYPRQKENVEEAPTPFQLNRVKYRWRKTTYYYFRTPDQTQIILWHKSFRDCWVVAALCSHLCALEDISIFKLRNTHLENLIGSFNFISLVVSVITHQFTKYTGIPDLGELEQFIDKVPVMLHMKHEVHSQP